MKEIKIVIQPQRLNMLHDVLRAVPGFPGMTVSRVERYNPSASDLSAGGRNRIRDELTDHSARVRVEMVVADELAEPLFDAALNNLSSGVPGDSAAWISEVGRAVFLRKTV